MEQNEKPILITQMRNAHSLGEQVLDDFNQKPLRRRFLIQARNSLQTIYGIEASIVVRYTDAIKKRNDITKDEYSALFKEFDQFLKLIEYTAGKETVSTISFPSAPPVGKHVFIVHGHDEMNTLRLKNLLKEHFDLSPVIMKNEPGKSQALLAKFEQVASICALAFVLITPDDEIKNQDQSYYQARPNVIFEAGWFTGRLGIPRVCLLLKNGSTVHSDIDGISRIHFQENVEEKAIEIKKELNAVNLL
jgi:predicted nucleotide-binding protein